MVTITSTSPGRVNLIGEHTDYNGGWVLPAALSVSLSVSLTPREDDTIAISTSGQREMIARSLSDEARGDWSDMTIGAVIKAHSLGWLSGGANILINSSIPVGAGLSSSAALIVTILKCARAHAKSQMSDLDIAIAAQEVEHEFIGVPCGIMDQVAVAIGEPNEAIALDTKTMDYERVRLPTSHTIMVLHSGYERQLSDGRYQERKLECDQAAEAFGTKELCLLEPQTIRNASHIDQTLRARALHCATEHRRVIAACKALQGSDMRKFGSLMNESHASMRDDFAMSIPPVDRLVEDAVSKGAFGARLTGGGFGGCVVACVPSSIVDDWKAETIAHNPKATIVDEIRNSD